MLSQVKEKINFLIANRARLTAEQRKNLFIKYIKEDSLFKKVIQIAYDPTKRYYLDKIKPRKRKNTKTLSLLNQYKAITEIFEILDQIPNIRHKKINGNTRLRISKLINDLDESEFFNQIMRKELRIGIDIETMLKMFKNLFDHIPVLRYSDVRYLHSIDFPIYSFEIPYSTSIDAYVVIKNKKVKYYTGLGRQIHIHSTTISSEFLNKGLDNVAYHVRLRIKQNDNLDKRYKTLKTPTGYYYTPLYISKILTFWFKDGKTKLNRYLEFHLLDIIPYDDFFNLGHDITLRERLQNPIFKLPDSKYLKIPKITYISEKKYMPDLIYKEKPNNIEFFLRTADRFWKIGHDRKTVLVDNQYRHILKIKHVFWGYTFGIKAIYCESDDRLIRAKVDEFFTEEQSKLNWKDMIGKNVIVQHSGVTQAPRHKTKTLQDAYFIDFTNELPDSSKTIIKRSKVLKWHKKRRNRDYKIKHKARKLRIQEKEYLKNLENGSMIVNKV